MMIGVLTPMRRPDATTFGRRRTACYDDRGLDPDETSPRTFVATGARACYDDRGLDPDETGMNGGASTSPTVLL